MYRPRLIKVQSHFSSAAKLQARCPPIPQLPFWHVLGAAMVLPPSVSVALARTSSLTGGSVVYRTHSGLDGMLEASSAPSTPQRR